MVADSKRKANDKYDAKTYRQVNFRLRVDDDAEIIKDMDDATSKGLNHREWLKNMFEIYKANK